MLNNKEIQEIHEFIKIVGPIAAKVGLSREETENLAEFLVKTKHAGISGNRAGIALRNYLKGKENSFVRSCGICIHMADSINGLCCTKRHRQILRDEFCNDFSSIDIRRNIDD